MLNGVLVHVDVGEYGPSSQAIVQFKDFYAFPSVLEELLPNIQKVSQVDKGAGLYLFFRLPVKDVM